MYFIHFHTIIYHCYFSCRVLSILTLAASCSPCTMAVLPHAATDRPETRIARCPGTLLRYSRCRPQGGRCTCVAHPLEYDYINYIWLYWHILTGTQWKGGNESKEQPSHGDVCFASLSRIKAQKPWPCNEASGFLPSDGIHSKKKQSQMPVNANFQALTLLKPQQTSHPSVTKHDLSAS